MDWKRGLLLLLVGCWGQGSLAAPLELGYQGRLLQSDGTPVEGTKTITFALYHDTDVSDPTRQPTATPAWTEDQQLALTDGFYATQLGVVQQLTPDLFDGSPLWLLLTVDGEPLLPLQKVTSVAYAVQAETATNVQGGVVDASSIHVAAGGSITVGGTEVIDAGGQINVATALPTTCQTGEVLKWDGSTWACAADADAGGDVTDVVAGNGLTGGGSAGSVTVGIAAGGVGTSEIADGAVTTAKLGFANGLTLDDALAGGVLDDTTPDAPYSRISADSFHTNGLGMGQIYIEGSSIDGNSPIYLGAGRAGGQGVQPVVTGSDLTIGGTMTANAFDKSGDGLVCTVEYDLIETGTNPASYWPSAAKRAELFQYGWICWNRSDDGQQVSPLNAPLLNEYYANWPAGNPKVCGRITWISNASDPNRSFLAHGQGSYYFGLRYLNGLNTWHGRWAYGGSEGSGGVGQSDRWTIWTCY